MERRQILIISGHVIYDWRPIHLIYRIVFLPIVWNVQILHITVVNIRSNSFLSFDSAQFVRGLSVHAVPRTFVHLLMLFLSNVTLLSLKLGHVDLRLLWLNVLWAL